MRRFWLKLLLRLGRKQDVVNYLRYRGLTNIEQAE